MTGTTATIGSLASSQTNFVLTRDSQKLYTSVCHANAVLNFFRDKGHINYEKKLESVDSAGVEVIMRNLYRTTGQPLRGDIDPYENLSDPLYGARRLTIGKLSKAFQYDRKESFTQQSTSTNLQDGHVENHENYMTALLVGGLFNHAGSNDATSIQNLEIDATGVTGDDRLGLTLNNLPPAPTAPWYKIANDVANPQSLTGADTISVKGIMEIFSTLTSYQSGYEPFNVSSVGTPGTLFMGVSDLHRLFNENVNVGSNFVFGDVYRALLSGGKVKEIGGMISTFQIPGIPFDFAVLPDSYFHNATHSSTKAAVANTRRLFVLGKGALDMATGRLSMGKGATSPFRVRVDNNWKPLGVKVPGVAEMALGVKKAQLPKRGAESTKVDLAVFTFDVHTGA